MRIQLHLNDENETSVFSLYDMTSNPFNVGDVIHLNVDDLYPVDTSEFKPEVRANFEKNNEQVRELFHLKSVRLMKEGKYVRFNVLNEPSLVIEYHCELVERD